MKNKIDLAFAELHTPLFLSNINFGIKLYNKQAKGELDLVYDRDEKELLVTCKGVLAIVPTPNVVSMTPKTKKIEMELAPAMANQHKTEKVPLNAQVSTPQDHVFAKGPGKTRD
jgi:hypothetical protein